MKVDDIDLARRFLVVRAGKYHQDRLIELTDPMTRRLGDFIRDKRRHESIFGVGPNAISEMFRRAARRSGMDMVPHDLRRYFACRLTDRGVDPDTVRRLLGHAYLSSTQQYLGRADHHQRSALEGLSDDTASRDALSSGIRRFPDPASTP